MDCINDIAQTLLALSGNASLNEIRLRNALGQDGYAEALERRWIESDYESGGIKMTSSAQLMADIHETAKSATKLKIPVKFKATGGIKNRQFVDRKEAPHEN